MELCRVNHSLYEDGAQYKVNHRVCVLPAVNGGRPRPQSDRTADQTVAFSPFLIKTLRLLFWRSKTKALPPEVLQPPGSRVILIQNHVVDV